MKSGCCYICYWREAWKCAITYLSFLYSHITYSGSGKIKGPVVNSNCPSCEFHGFHHYCILVFTYGFFFVRLLWIRHYFLQLYIIKKISKSLNRRNFKSCRWGVIYCFDDIFVIRGLLIILDVVAIDKVSVPTCCQLCIPIVHDGFLFIWSIFPIVPVTSLIVINLILLSSIIRWWPLVHKKLIWKSYAFSDTFGTFWWSETILLSRIEHFVYHV